MFKCWILLKPVLREAWTLTCFTLPFMKRLNQTETATYGILLFWAFFRGSFFPVLWSLSRLSFSLRTPGSNYWLAWIANGFCVNTRDVFSTYWKNQNLGSEPNQAFHLRFVPRSCWGFVILYSVASSNLCLSLCHAVT